MRTIEVELEDNLWQTLHAEAENSGTTIPELIRQAVQKEYMAYPGRKEAMMGIVGSGKIATIYLIPKLTSEAFVQITV